MKGFLEHMHVDHSERINETQLLSLRGAFQRPSKAQHGLCTLCGKHASILKSHLAKHLEQLALFAIPQTHYMSDEVQGGSDTNVARQSVVELKRSNSSTVSARSSLNSRRSFDSREAFFLQRDPSIDEDFQQQEIVPDISGHLEGEVDTSWDHIPSKFQDARGSTPSVRAGKLDDSLPEDNLASDEVFPTRIGGPSHSRNTAVDLSSPPPPPKIMFIPAEPRGSLESQDSRSKADGARLAVLSRVRRLLSNSKNQTKFGISPMQQETSQQETPPESTEPILEDTTLHPFWRPRGFWDGFGDSDSEEANDEEDRLPAGGDTSLDHDVDPDNDNGDSHKELEAKNRGWRQRWPSLTTGKLDEMSVKAKSYLGRKEGKRKVGSADGKQTRREEPGVQMGSYRVVPVNPIKWYRDIRNERRRERIRKKIGDRSFLMSSDVV